MGADFVVCRLADLIATLPRKPDVGYGRVAYRDGGDAFFVRGADSTNDLSAFQSTRASLQASGGGDNPEAMNEALRTAVHRQSWRGEGTARLVGWWPIPRRTRLRPPDL